MVPEPLIGHSVRDGEVVLHYLTERDHLWLRALLEEYERFVGRPRRELDERLREPLPCASPPRKTRLASHVLDRLYGGRDDAAIPPPEARAAVFGEAARSMDDAEAILARVARDLRVAPALLRESLFADLPGERRLVAPRSPIAPGELALRANSALAQAVLHRSISVEIEAEGNARAVVRHAKLRGLICAVAARGARGDAALEISGPMSLFRRTLLYGRALAELVPLLAWCTRFHLRSDCVLRERTLRFVLRSGDPVFPASEPRLFDSRLEERFARDFRRVAPEWDVIREPEAVEASGKLLFPDFVLQHRGDSARRWLLEIVGFWTPGYLERKLAQLRAARISNLIVCLDDDRNCAEGDLPADTRVVRFRRRIDADAVLRIVDAVAHAPTSAAGPRSSPARPREGRR